MGSNPAPWGPILPRRFSSCPAGSCPAMKGPILTHQVPRRPTGSDAALEGPILPRGGWHGPGEAAGGRGRTLAACQTAEPGAKNTHGAQADGSGGVGTGCSGPGGAELRCPGPRWGPSNPAAGPHRNGWQHRLLGPHRGAPQNAPRREEHHGHPRRGGRTQAGLRPLPRRGHGQGPSGNAK